MCIKSILRNLVRYYVHFIHDIRVKRILRLSNSLNKFHCVGFLFLEPSLGVKSKDPVKGTPTVESFMSHAFYNILLVFQFIILLYIQQRRRNSIKITKNRIPKPIRLEWLLPWLKWTLHKKKRESQISDLNRDLSQSLVDQLTEGKIT